VAGFNEGRTRPGGIGTSGTSGSVQFKSGSTFAGDNEFNYNPTTDYLSVTGTISASYFYGDGSNLTGVGGDVTGPGSSTDDAIVRFDGTGGKTLQNSGITIDNSNNMNGVASLDMSAMSTGYFEVGVGGVPLELYDGTADGILNIKDGEMDWEGNTDLGANANSYHKVSGTLDVSGSVKALGFAPNRVAYASTTTITDVTAIAGVTLGSITLTLPAVSTFSGSTLIIKDESGTVSGSNTVIVSCSSGVTIDGATTATISSPYGSISTYHNGTNWFIY